MLKGFSGRPICEFEDEEPLAPLHAEPEQVHQVLVAHLWRMYGGPIVRKILAGGLCSSVRG